MNQVQLPLILAIDTSCDETSAAVTLGPIVLSNVIASQINIHQAYGGVYPTLAKQAHQEKIEPVIKQALTRAGISHQLLDAIAVTVGPGLAPALEIGIAQAKKLAQVWQKPLIAVNHVEAHLLSVLAISKQKDLPIKKILSCKKNHQDVPQSTLAHINQLEHFLNLQKSSFSPCLGLVLSGGHTQIVLINNIQDYQILGETIDDAAGEALDKVGRILGLGYPAAPVIEQLAKDGNPDKFKFPLPMTGVKNYNLSFSGLKTAAHRSIKELLSQNNFNKQAIIDFAASFQHAVFTHLCYKLNKVLIDQANMNLNKSFSNTQLSQVWLGGGVANNIYLRSMVRKVLRPFKINLKVPYSKNLCSDNAAMIGVSAAYYLKYFPHTSSVLPSTILTSPIFDRKPNWPLTLINQ